MLAKRLFQFGCVGFGLALMMASAWGSVADWRGLAASDPDLIHHWTFEGASGAERQQDKQGTANLTVAGPSGMSSPTFATGFDASTTAANFAGATGKGFHSASFIHPEEGTVEFLYRPDVIASSMHMVATSVGGGNRLYYGAGIDTGTEIVNGLAIGHDGTAQSWVNSQGHYLTSSTAPDLEAGHWYYVAVARKRTGTSIAVDAYVADLTEGQSQLTHAISTTKTCQNANFGTQALGIGMRGTGSDLVFDGGIDEVAHYDATLNQPTLQTHLDALYSTYAAEVYSDNPLAYWRFEDATSADGDRATDSKGSLHGTYDQQVGLVPGVAPIGGQAASFDGADDAVDLLSSALRTTLTGAKAITIEAWINNADFPEGTDSNAIFATRVNGGGAGAEILLENGRIRVAGRSQPSPADGYQQANVALDSTGQWHHVVGILDYENDLIRVFIDGREELSQPAVFGSATYAPGTSFTQIDRIGGHPGGTAKYYFHGLLDEVAVYDYALSPERIRQHYSAGVPEPTTLALLGLGLAALARRRRR